MSRRLRHSRYANSTGATLVELVLTIVIMAIALSASLSAFSLLIGRSADGFSQNKSAQLAQLYFDEILARGFDHDTGLGGIPAYTGPCRVGNNGETRADFNDVDDYDIIDQEQPALIDQSLAGLYDGYRVSVSVQCVNDVGVNTQGAKLIQLTVQDPRNQTARFAVYKGNY